MNKKYTVSAIIISFLLFACQLFAQSKPLGERIYIGYYANRISLPLFVAQKKKFFRQAGIEVRLERFETAQALLDSLIDGKVQLGGYLPVSLVYASMVSTKVDAYFATAMLEDDNHRINYLLVPKGAPKSFSISDLKGKRIGILPTAASKAWLLEILKKNHVDTSRVEVIPILPKTSKAALEKKQIDGLYTNDPTATSLLQSGVARLLDEKKVETADAMIKPFLYASFNVKRGYFTSQEQITRKVIEALNSAIDFIRSHQKEAKAIMEEYLPAGEKALAEYYPDASYVASKEVQLADFEKISDLYYRIGLTTKKIPTRN